MTATTTKVTWRAGSERIAHAHAPRATRTICGLLVVPQNLSWPELRKCRGCEKALFDNPGLGL